MGQLFELKHGGPGMAPQDEVGSRIYQVFHMQLDLRPGSPARLDLLIDN